MFIQFEQKEFHGRLSAEIYTHMRHMLPTNFLSWIIIGHWNKLNEKRTKIKLPSAKTKQFSVNKPLWNTLTMLLRKDRPFFENWRIPCHDNTANESLSEMIILIFLSSTYEFQKSRIKQYFYNQFYQLFYPMRFLLLKKFAMLFVLLNSELHYKYFCNHFLFTFIGRRCHYKTK